eukprot:2187101-Karenia_brevis.AAC.1
MQAHQQPNPRTVRAAATQDMSINNEENDVALALLKGQNVPRSQRLRLSDHTEEWLFEFIEDVVGLKAGPNHEFM